MLCRIASSVAAGLLAAASAHAGEAKDAVPSWVCGDFASLASGELVVENNVWNKQQQTDYDQCIRLAGARGVAQWRWRWRGGDLVPEAYPEAIFGHKPWRPISTTSRLPASLARLRRLAVSYDLESHSDGEYNTAFDLWLLRPGPVAPEAIAVEVMIWVRNAGLRPAGDPQGEVAVDGAVYDLFAGPMRSWRIATFVRRQPMRRGSLRLDSFLSELVRRELAAPDLQLASVELGNELAGGRGHAFLRRFEVEVETAAAP